jgi:hypothetical protein
MKRISIIIVVMIAFTLFASLASAGWLEDLYALLFGKSSGDFFVKLIENKASLTEGYAIFEVKNPLGTDITIDSSILNFIFVKYSGNQVNSYNILFLDTESVSEQITDYAQDCMFTNTNHTGKICKNIAVGWHWSNYTVEKYKPLTSIILKPNDIKKIKIVAYWNAHTGTQSIEWIPKLKFETIEYVHYDWAWWNTSFDYKRNITCGLKGARSSNPAIDEPPINATGTNREIWLNTSEITNCSTNIRYVNAAENKENPFDVLPDSSSGRCHLRFLVNATTDGAVCGYLYYDKDVTSYPTITGSLRALGNTLVKNSKVQWTFVDKGMSSAIRLDGENSDLCLNSMCMGIISATECIGTWGCEGGDLAYINYTCADNKNCTVAIDVGHTSDNGKLRLNWTVWDNDFIDIYVNTTSGPFSLFSTLDTTDFNAINTFQTDRGQTVLLVGGSNLNANATRWWQWHDTAPDKDNFGFVWRHNSTYKSYFGSNTTTNNMFYASGQYGGYYFYNATAPNYLIQPITFPEYNIGKCKDCWTFMARLYVGKNEGGQTWSVAENATIRFNKFLNPVEIVIGNEEEPFNPINYTSTNLWLNGTRANYTISYGEPVNFTGVVNASGTVVIFINTTALNAGISPYTLWSNKSYLPVGIHNISAVFLSNGTFNKSIESWNLTVIKANSSTIVTFNSTSPIEYVYENTISYNLGIQCNPNGTDKTTIDIWRNITSVSQIANAVVGTYNDTIGGGWWNYSCYISASQNYTSSLSLNNNMQVLQGDSGITGVFNTTSPKGFHSGLGFECDVNRTYNGQSNVIPNISILINNSIVNSTVGVYGDADTHNLTVFNISNLGVGWWNYSCYINATDNFTAAYDIDNNFEITQLQTNISLNRSSTASYTYGNMTKFVCEANNEIAAHLYVNKTNKDAWNNTELQLGVGWWNFTCNVTGNVNVTSNETFKYVLVNITNPATNMSVTSNKGWIIDDGIITTLTGSETNNGDLDLTYSLESRGVPISNPYSSTFDSGTYNITYYTAGGSNFTAGYVNYNLTSRALSLGCTHKNIYAYETIVVSSASVTQVNMSYFLNDSMLTINMTDVNVTNMAESIPLYFTKIAPDSIVVNNSGNTSFKIRFGNYLADNIYPQWQFGAVSDKLTNVSSYNVSNYSTHIFLIKDEIFNTSVLPPTANITMTLYCTNGETFFPVNHTRLIIPVIKNVTLVKTNVNTTAGNWYRHLIPSNSSDSRNVWLVDANIYQVSQMILTVSDSTGRFGNAIIRIKKVIVSSLETITELPIDIEKKAIVYLLTGGRYQVYVSNGQEERVLGNLYVDIADLTKTIYISEFTQLNRTISNISRSLTYNGSIINFRWIDYASKTNQIDFYVLNATNQSELFHVQGTNVSRYEINYFVPTVNETYLVKYVVKHGQFGNDTTIFQDFMMAVSASFPSVSIPLFDLIQSMTGTNSEIYGQASAATISQFWLALLILIPIPMIFTQKYAGIGIIAMLGIAALFTIWINFTIASGVLLIVLVLAVIVEINSRRRED